ncbi:hypothetical protein D3C80_1637770 [compost metagenome]
MLTEVVFAGQDIERINLPYNESLTRIERGEIDATVWNVTEDLDSLNLVKEPLNHYPVSIKASEAVLLVRNDDRVIPHLVKTLVNLQRLLAHQQEVKKGTREPSY